MEQKITVLVSALAIVFSIIAPLTVYAEETVKPSINAVRYENGNTVVTISNISGGEVIAVKYDRGIAAAVKRAEVTGDTATLEGIEADKVMVWNSLNGMKPICEAYSVKSDIPLLHFRLRLRWLRKQIKTVCLRIRLLQQMP